MVEVEAKIMLPDCTALDTVERKLVEMGASLVEERVERDTYYQHPCRDFAETDEALRLREAGGRVELTYKGPKRIVGGSKAREEYSVTVLGYSEMHRILTALGFRPVAQVVKHRKYYVLDEANITLDRVEGLGCFVEIEYQGEKPVEEAARAIEETAEKLGIAGYKRVYKSYLELLLEKSLQRRQRQG